MCFLYLRKKVPLEEKKNQQRSAVCFDERMLPSSGSLATMRAETEL